MSADNFKELLTQVLKAHGPENEAKASELLALVRKSKEPKVGTPSAPESDCPEDVEDCSDIMSPCCNAPVATIFGTLPLKVGCKSCGKEYLMGALIRELLKSKRRLPQL